MRRYVGSIVLVTELAFVCFYAGCDSKVTDENQAAADGEIQSAAQTKSSAREKSFDSPIAVRIDGQDILRQDLIRNGRMMLQLNMNKRRTTKVGRAEQKFLRSYLRRAVPLAIGRSAVVRYLKEQGVSVSSNDILRVSRSFERKYGVRSKKLKRWHTIDDLKYMLGNISPCLDKEILACAQYDMATNVIIQSSKIEITSQMVSDRIKAITDYNRRIASTNAFIFAHATNVWRQIVAKEMTFEDAAQKYSEDAYLSDGIEWGSFSQDQLADEPAVLALVPTLKVGDITPPVESDGGLTILRRDENGNPDIISFSRIFFRLPIFYEVESADEARQSMKVAKESKLLKETLDAIAGKLKVEYPDGTNVMSQAITAKEFAN